MYPGHGTLLREPHVAGVASRLRASFDSSDSERRMPPRLETFGASTGKERSVTPVNGNPSDPTRTVLAVIRHLQDLDPGEEPARHPSQRAGSRGFAQYLAAAVVIDNASGDAEPIQRAVTSPRGRTGVTVVAAPRNGGFAYGNNLGFRHGFESAAVPDYFFLLNPTPRCALAPSLRWCGFSTSIRCRDRRQQLEDENGQPWPFAFRYPTLLSEIDHGLRLGVVSRLLRNHIVTRPWAASPSKWIGSLALP